MSRDNAECDVGFESEGLRHGRFLNFKFQNSTFKPHMQNDLNGESEKTEVTED